jgi:hypothetical protein
MEQDPSAQARLSSLVSEAAAAAAASGPGGSGGAAQALGLTCLGLRLRLRQLLDQVGQLCGGAGVAVTRCEFLAACAQEHVPQLVAALAPHVAAPGGPTLPPRRAGKQAAAAAAAAADDGEQQVAEQVDEENAFECIRYYLATLQQLFSELVSGQPPQAGRAWRQSVVVLLLHLNCSESWQGPLLRRVNWSSGVLLKR